MYEVSDDLVGGGAVEGADAAAARDRAADIPDLEEEGQRERYYHGRDEQQAVRDILVAIDRKRGRRAIGTIVRSSRARAT